MNIITDVRQSGSWKIIDSDYQTGSFNMEYDLKLVDECNTGNKKYLRFYRWKPYAISLGYNQKKMREGKKINYDKCREDNIDVVERPTGGRAILHSDELTYAVIMKTDRPVKDVYYDISDAIVRGLKRIDPHNAKLQELALTQDTPDLRKLMKTGMYNLCFASAVKYEVNLKGKKLVGSAQRRMGDVMLQHGSILLGTHHKNIVKYLFTESKEEEDKIKQELDNKTISLYEILDRNVTYETARDNLLRGFEETLLQLS